MAITGSIIGDIIGSQYEFERPHDFNYKTAPLLTQDCKFTDDTVLSIATKAAIQNGIPFSEAYRDFGLKYRDRGCGSMFCDWLDSTNKEPYNSFGNGAAMRVSFIGEYYRTLEDVVRVATESAECTHNHIEGVKGALTTAACVWIAKHRGTKSDIYEFANKMYPKESSQYGVAVSIDSIADNYTWNETCQGSVPVAIRCVLEADSYVGFIRNVFKLRCDTDTLCAIGGGIAEELFGGTGLNNDEILMRYLDTYLLNNLKVSKRTEVCDKTIVD